MDFLELSNLHTIICTDMLTYVIRQKLCLLILHVEKKFLRIEQRFVALQCMSFSCMSSS